MKGLSILGALMLSSVLIFGTAQTAQAVIWADFVKDFTGSPTPSFAGGNDADGDGFFEVGDSLFISGVDPAVALGEPDSSYVSIFADEFITLGFSTPFLNGPGIDFFVVETGHADEGAFVAVSSDGISFTSIGTVDVPLGGANSTTFGDYYGFDLGTFTDPVSFVKVSDSVLGASAGFDLAGIGANFPIPEPATMFLLGSGLLGLVGFGRKRRSFCRYK